MRVIPGLILLLLVPAFAFAQTRSGFPDRSIWLSNAKPAYGEEIKIYTVVYNGTDADFSGTVVFLVDGKTLDSQAVKLGAQSSEVVATKWKATSGDHTFGARFGTGATSETLQQTTSLAVKVAEPPPPTALQESVKTATAVATTFASSSAPIVTKVASAVFEKTEAIRTAGIEYLESKLDEGEPLPVVAASASSSASPGLVAGTSTAPTAKSVKGFGTSSAAAASSDSSSTLHTIGQAGASALLFTMKKVYIFYPLFAFIFFYLLYRAYRLFRRPKY
ncbi:MAG TPA: hypothetical protein VJK53_01760 [Candidatus Paceibacterota bacterium]